MRRVRETRAVRLYRRLLFAYPAAFRDEYAHELCLAFVDRYREARSAQGTLEVWTEAVGGILHEAPREHLQMRSRSAAC